MSSNSEDQPTEALSRLVHEAIEQLGTNCDKDALIARIQSLSLGLSNEDEFSFLLGWLGRCTLIHKLDQVQIPPHSRKMMIVPDFMAFFRMGQKVLPVLIEVKTTKQPKLSWRKDYYNGLMEYAKALNLPLLIAWKWRPYDKWLLFDATHFWMGESNFKMDLNKAAQENLMGVLAGDFLVGLDPDFGFHMRFKKVEKIGTFEEDGKPFSQWNMQAEDAFFTNSENERLKSVSGGIWSTLLCYETEKYDEEVDDGFTVTFRPTGETLQDAHRIFVMLLKGLKEKDGAIHWRKIIEEHEYPIEFSKLEREIQEGLELKVVQYIIHQVPKTKLPFLTI